MKRPGVTPSGTAVRDRGLALLAQRVRAFAEIAHDLEQTLLRGGGGELLRRSRTEQSLARKLEHRVVLGGGPREINLLDTTLHRRAATGGGPRPAPPGPDVG